MRDGAMKSILVIAGTAVGAALIGLIGAYFVLPQVVPSIGADAEPDPPVASTADSAMTQKDRPDTTRSSEETAPARVQDSASQDSPPTPAEKSGADGMDGADGMEDASRADPPRTASEEPSGTNEQDSTRTAMIQALRDSVQSLQRRLQSAQQSADTLREETSRLREKLATTADERAKVNELSDALMDMRRRGLSNLLQEVEMSVLKKLYQETTGKARTRLLQSMDPGRAARFVNQVVDEEGDEPASASPAAEEAAPASE